MVLQRVSKYVGRGLAVVGALTVAKSWIHYKAQSARSALPDAFVLDLNLEDVQLVEKASPLQALQGGRPQVELRRLVDALGAAGGDARVAGLAGHLGDGVLASVAQAQELRAAVARFRQEAGTRAPTVAYADTFGEGGAGGSAAYYLASAFQRVYMQPSGLLSLTGLATFEVFKRPFLDKWRIRPLFFAREEYKGAAAGWTEAGWPPPQRAALAELLGGLLAQMAEGIAASRGLSRQQVEAEVDAAPLTAKQAVKARLLDGLKYRDEATRFTAATEGADGKGKALPHLSALTYLRVVEAERRKRKRQQQQGDPDADSLSAMLSQLGRAAAAWASGQPPVNEAADAAQREADARAAEGGADAQKRAAVAQPARKPAVALLRLSGPIVTGEGHRQPLQKDSVIASGPTCRALRAARADPTVRALVLRIDSGGGSAIASDTIWREVQLTVDAGKPVVVSMGSVAASGGYYIAAPATRIVAQPATITGSIGVLWGKFDAAGLLRELGLNPEVVAAGCNADAALPVTGLTPPQAAKVEEMMDETYGSFLGKVAAGRRLAPQAARAAAKGRVWSGQQALQLGLVDALGGLSDALALARREAGLPAEEDAVEVVEFPRRRPPLQQALAELARATGGAPPDVPRDAGGAAGDSLPAQLGALLQGLASLAALGQLLGGSEAGQALLRAAAQQPAAEGVQAAAPVANDAGRAR